jgi:cephalosporin-C deacetylase
MRRIIFLFGIVFFTVASVRAQAVEQAVKIMISQNHPDWTCKTGDKTKFSISVLKNTVPLRNVKVVYQVGLERMKPFKQDSVLLKDGTFETDDYTLHQPGFLRCIVTATWEGKQYKNLVTIGYDIEKLLPVTRKPADFDSFWQKTMGELAQVPLDAKMTLLPEKGSSLTNVYHVNVQSYGNSRLYGILCVPRKPGKYPAILQVPGAGVRAYNPDLELADKGVIVFTIGIHGIPVTLDPVVYNNLNDGALKGYFFFNLENRDRFYYKRVYAGCIRANDFIVSLPEFDGSNLAVTGNSQGGALSIITASLDKRVKCLGSIHPALCDLTGYFAGRAGGWPHYFADNNTWVVNREEAIKTTGYYDVVNFARELAADGFYTWGFNDETCPPTSMHAAYNIISAGKTLSLFAETGHWFYPEQKAAMNNWVLSYFTK